MSAASDPGTLVVLPAFNEEVALPGVVHEIASALPQVTLLVVDDGSSDHTTETAQDLGVDVVTLPFNLGVGGALRAGFRYASRHKFTSMVQVDADGQHDPAAIPDLLARLQTADLVIGARFAGRDGYEVERVRRLAMWLLARSLSRRTKTRLTDTTSGFRAFGPRAIALFAQQYPAEYLGDTIEALLIAAREDLVVAQVPVVMRQRAGGTPSHSALSSAVLLARTLPAFVLPRPRLTTAGIEHAEAR
jgi:glycosyltransferase involved in cell wall biosynthesis